MDNSYHKLDQDYRVTAIQVWVMYDITELLVQMFFPD